MTWSCVTRLHTASGVDGGDGVGPMRALSAAPCCRFTTTLGTASTEAESELVKIVGVCEVELVVDVAARSAMMLVVDGAEKTKDFPAVLDLVLHEAASDCAPIVTPRLVFDVPSIPISTLVGRIWATCFRILLSANTNGTFGLLAVITGVTFSFPGSIFFPFAVVVVSEAEAGFQNGLSEDTFEIRGLEEAEEVVFSCWDFFFFRSFLLTVAPSLRS